MTPRGNRGVPAQGDATMGGAYYSRGGRTLFTRRTSLALNARAFLGGTFDPVHVGHLHAARSVATALGVRLITLVLAARPPHRTASANAAHRWEMLRLAVADEAGLAASDIELRRDGPSYSIDTIESFGEGEPIVWIVGSDGLDTFAAWHRSGAFAECCHIVVVARPGSRVTALPGFTQVADPACLARRTHGCLLVLTQSMLDVSSTRIRRVLSRGGDASALLPSPVWTYIKQRGLYHR